MQCSSIPPPSHFLPIVGSHIPHPRKHVKVYCCRYFLLLFLTLNFLRFFFLSFSLLFTFSTFLFKFSQVFLTIINQISVWLTMASPSFLFAIPYFLLFFCLRFLSLFCFLLQPLFFSSLGCDRVLLRLYFFFNQYFLLSFS